jgi:hypothetical protein
MSRAFVLCKGLAWTRSVKALSLSERVPEWITLLKKVVSEEDEEEDGER